MLQVQCLEKNFQFTKSINSTFSQCVSFNFSWELDYIELENAMFLQKSIKEPKRSPGREHRYIGYPKHEEDVHDPSSTVESEKAQ